MRTRFSAVLGFLCVFLLTFAASAQPLSDKVPGDAMLYIGWSGADAMGPEYSASHLKAVLDASDAQKLFTDFLPRVFQKVGESDRDVRQFGEMFNAIVAPMWKHPTAICFSGVDWPDAGPPMPKLALLCNAGADAPGLVAQVKAAIEKAGGSPVPVNISESAGLVSLVVGKASADTTKITDAAGFKSAVAKVHGKPVAVVYIDGEAMIKEINTAVERSGDRKAAREWPKARQALGLDGFKAAIWTAAFEGKNWSTRAFIAAPAPRAGVMKFLDAKPLPEDTLKVVPQGAILAAAGRFDLGKAYDAVREMVASLEPRAAQEMDAEVAKFNARLGMDLRQDVLGSIGDTWVYYVDPMTGGNGILGGVFVNKLADPAKAQKALAAVEKAVNDLIAKETAREPVKIAIKQKTIDGLDVHYLAIPIITPAWTIKNGQWIVGLFPQTVVGAARNIDGGGKTLLDNPAYVELRKNLGDPPASAVDFMDLPKLAPHGYSTWLLITRYAGFGDLFGIESPLMILPPMYKLQEHLSASGSATWSTDEGVHYRAVTPFPGANVVSADPMSMMGLMQPMVLAGLIGMSAPMGRHHAVADLELPQSFYSDDDGKTWFADAADKVPPFDRQGKSAVRVYVFKCGENGPPFVGYMERYTPQAAEKMEEMMKGHGGDAVEMERIQMSGVEVKKPGGKWVLRNTPEAEKVMDVKCPDGTTNNLEPLSPMD